MTWQEQGLCYDSASPIFFPSRAEMTTKEYNDTVEKAKAICNRCPVKARCAEELENNEYGIWGGELA